MADAQAIWVCADCRSVNKLRAKQCYNCRTPKHRAAVDPSQIDPTTKGQIREVALPAFHSSRRYAVVASILILVVAALQAIGTLLVVPLLFRLVGGRLVSDDELLSLGVLGLSSTGIALIALIGWALWLSKVVRAMPALGLGYPATNGLMAFWENFIPLFNLWRVPAIVRDIFRRLEPDKPTAGVMIAAAWLGLLAGYLLPRVGGFINSRVSRTLDGYVRNLVVIELVALGLVLISSVLLVVLIWRIERRISRRQAALSAAARKGGLLPVEASGLAATPGGVAWAVAGSGTNFGTTAPAAPPPTAVAVTVPGPLGSVVVEDEPDVLASRPITTVTGPGVLAEAADPAPAPEQVAGPILELTIAHDGSMVATLDGESEPITVTDLREAAKALVRVDGSAVVRVGDGSPEAISMASQALQTFADAGVPATTAHQPG